MSGCFCFNTQDAKIIIFFPLKTRNALNITLRVDSLLQFMTKSGTQTGTIEIEIETFSDAIHITNSEI